MSHSDKWHWFLSDNIYISIKMFCPVWWMLLTSSDIGVTQSVWYTRVCQYWRCVCVVAVSHARRVRRVSPFRDTDCIRYWLQMAAAHSAWKELEEWQIFGDLLEEIFSLKKINSLSFSKIHTYMQQNRTNNIFNNNLTLFNKHFNLNDTKNYC